MTWHDVLFGFDGRIGRKTFWVAFIAVTAIELLCHAIANEIDGERLTSIISLAFSYPEFAIMAKRGHDRGMPTVVPGAFFAISVLIDFLFVIGEAGTADQPTPLLLLLTVPWLVFALVLLIDLGFRPGTPGPNRYGPDPQARGLRRIDGSE
ncbi:MAG: DUF805 domain-containing protein [Rhodoplanes sp.]|uniref:DUF805 domain-containing protein n=1 Tax=Rhodoplanes sp. TaxID=1968906 RepID=UPI0017AFAB95|nr:DUF805 domain-containing protein [Rhodoplanes sp.]NVO15399.1 DUF805 domain-containing protein [Rhodoplanes sp.]